MESRDNAGVYKLSDDIAIVQTVDFFTPVVDDPYTFGQIAVANSLSDVYTMGAKPLTALNMACFPIKTMDISVLREILRGGADKLAEAGVILIGGHSVDDLELKYGLAVTGTVHPSKLLTNSGARPGDKLILTKPLGNGVITTALKAKLVDEETVDLITKSMVVLNHKASQIMQEVGVNGCTDITGFGFLGHAAQMAQNSKAGMQIKVSDIPFFPRAQDFARQGFCPAGLHRNRDFYSNCVKTEPSMPDYIVDVLYDPQTSGGLLISVPSKKADLLLEKLHLAGVTAAAVIGEVTAETPGMLTLLK
jgi:selenide, water dikinase